MVIHRCFNWFPSDSSLEKDNPELTELTKTDLEEDCSILNFIYIWVNYNDLTVSKGNHPQMALIQGGHMAQDLHDGVTDTPGRTNFWASQF